MKISTILETLSDPPLEEMATLYPSETGLASPIWIGKVGGQHGPRVKVSNSTTKWRQNDNFTIGIDPSRPAIQAGRLKLDPKDLAKIERWIVANYDDLMTLWWMFERGAATVVDEDGETVSFDDIIDRLKVV